MRFTDLTGGYAFHADPGTYGIAASGQCPMTPATTKVAASASTVRDFAGAAGCVTATRSNVIATGAVFTVSSAGTVLGTSFANLAQFATAGDAQARLQEIAAEQAAPYPLAHDRRVPCHRAPAGRDARTPDPDFQGGPGDNDASFLTLTAAIAVGSTVVRYESYLDPDADAATIATFFQADRNFTPDALSDLHGLPATVVPMLQNSPVTPPSVLGILASGLLAPGSFGELQVAASDTANAIVYGTQNGPFVSKDGGQTVNASTFNTVAAPDAAAFVSLGDPTVGVGAPDDALHQRGSTSEDHAKAPPQFVAHVPERLEPLGLRRAGVRRIGQTPMDPERVA